MFEIYLSSYTKRLYQKQAKVTTFVGIFCIIIISSLMHFAFDFFGKVRWTAAFFPVNESVWEHLKMGFFSAFVFYIIEFIIYGRRFENFIPAKSVALFLIPFLTAVFYFLYTAFLEENLILSIMTLVVATIISQLISLKITLSRKRIKKAPFILIVIILLILFTLFTYFPPKIPELFYDFATKKYGI